MCMETSGVNKVCLIALWGGAYCDGNVCFGMGARGTHDASKATCGRCLERYHQKAAERRNMSIVDMLAELADEDGLRTYLHFARANDPFGLRRLGA